MNDFTKFKVDLVENLAQNEIPQEMTMTILECVVTALNDYELVPKTTDIIVVETPANLKYYLATMKLGGRADETIYGYRLLLEEFCRFVQKPEDQITDRDIWAFLMWHQNNREKTVLKSTIEHYRSILSSYFRWLKSQGIITLNPMDNVAPIKCEKRVRHAMTRKELTVVMDSCKTAKDKAFLSLAYFTGCRVAEISTIKRTDIDWYTMSVPVIGKGDKERIVNFSETTAMYLKEYLNTRHDESPYLFVSEKAPHGKVCTKTLRRWLASIMDNVPEGMVNTHVTPHVIRHTTATLAIQNGMQVTDVQRMLGHSSVETTMKYIDSDKLDLRRSYDKYVV